MNTEYSDNPRIVTLTFIIPAPSNIDTVHIALLMAADTGMTVGVEKIVVKFDISLYKKALDCISCVTPVSFTEKFV